MPLYEYACPDCHQHYEKLQKMSDPPCKKCPRCGGALKKLISSPAIQFKGNGFYINDYPKKSGPSVESKPNPAAESKPAAAESKPEPKKSGSQNAE